MELYSGYINKLIEQFAKLPGVGNKSAQRLALHVINMPSEHVERFAQIMVDAKKKHSLLQHLLYPYGQRDLSDLCECEPGS